MAKAKKSKKSKQKKVAKKKSSRAFWLLLLLVPLAALPFLSSSSGEKIKDFGYEVVRKWPHDPEAYTQGLAYYNGYFFEGTGLYGKSTLRKVDPASGTVLKQIKLAPRYFGEGVAIVGGTLVQLTWKEEKVFVYNSDTFELLREYDTKGEGWGLTYDGTHLISSNGSDKLSYHDKSDFSLIKEVLVRDRGRPVRNLNELEFIDGKIWANVWQTNRIVQIDPKSGEVVGRIDLKGILKNKDRNGREDVLNGIAYDPENNRIFVTGKRYSHIYEIKLVPKRRN